MRRDTFLKSLAAMAAVGSLPVSAQTAALKMMIPANPGGGWDTTGRAGQGHARCGCRFVSVL